MDYSKMEYKELQEVAKGKGLPYHRISQEDLLASLQETDEKDLDEVSQTETSEDKLPEDEKDESSDNDSQNDEVVDDGLDSEDITPNTAIVYNQSLAHTIRIYSKKDHGDNFEALAKQFVSQHKQYSIELKFVKEPVYCKNCGAQIIE